MSFIRTAFKLTKLHIQTRDPHPFSRRRSFERRLLSLIELIEIDSLYIAAP